MKIGFFYIKAGNGHYIPAKALYEKTIEEYGRDSAVLADLYRDVVDEPGIADWTEKMWSNTMLHPNRERFNSFMYDNNILFCKSLHNLYMKRRLAKKFGEYILENKIDAIVSTNCVISCIIAKLIKKNKLNIHVYHYYSDVVFAYKFVTKDRDVYGYFAPSEQCVSDAISKGAPADRVYKIPFPIQNQIKSAPRLSKSDARKKLGLDDKFTVVYQIGGEGTGRFKLLELCAKNKLDIQFIILGRLKDNIRQDLEKLFEAYPDLRVITPGFVSNVQDYVQAADMITSQSGLNAIMEAFYLGRPAMITTLFYVGVPFAKLFEKYDVGFTAETYDRQFELIEYLSRHPDKVGCMEANIEKLDFEYDSAEAVRIINKKIQRNCIMAENEGGGYENLTFFCSEKNDSGASLCIKGVAA